MPVLGPWADSFPLPPCKCWHPSEITAGPLGDGGVRVVDGTLPPPPPPLIAPLLGHHCLSELMNSAAARRGWDQRCKSGAGSGQGEELEERVHGEGVGRSHQMGKESYSSS